MLGADVIVLELAGFGLSSVQRLLQVGAKKQVGRARALDLMTPGEFALEIRLQLGNGHTDLLQQIRDEAVGLVLRFGRLSPLLVLFRMGLGIPDEFFHFVRAADGNNFGVFVDGNSARHFRQF